MRRGIFVVAIALVVASCDGSDADKAQTSPSAQTRAPPLSAEFPAVPLLIIHTVTVDFWHAYLYKKRAALDALSTDAMVARVATFEQATLTRRRGGRFRTPPACSRTTPARDYAKMIVNRLKADHDSYPSAALVQARWGMAVAAWAGVPYRRRSSM